LGNNSLGYKSASASRLGVSGFLSGFEGCIRSLTAMNLIARVPTAQRSASQKQTAQRFDEFGCTLCHQIVPGKMGLTELGAKLTHMHLGCVDVEKTLASK